MEYDFKSLSDYDFELLCCDLLSREFGVQLENFKKGKDGGVDLRYATNKANSLIVQCKHYAKSKFSDLKKSIKNEISKIKTLNPNRYILITSLELSIKNKAQLLSLLDPYCSTESDIIGGNEINTFLRKYPDIEKLHYKLWLTSTGVLEKILKSDVYNRSDFTVEEIQDKLRIYVQSLKAFDKAVELLNVNNCCIISGIPGIGKTTLAEILLIHYLDQGYQIFKISSNIGEAIGTYNTGDKQVFLYDDFLGTSGLEMKLNKNEGKDILMFMDRISKKSDKKFILTTREYILNQAQETYEELTRHDFSLNKCIISLEDYNKSDKAKILYNHLYFNQVPKDYLCNLLESNNVLDIINHKNYSPRLIASMTKVFLPSNASSFYNEFISNLDNPEKLWSHAFNNQISENARHLLLLLITFTNKLEVKKLQLFYDAYHLERCKNYNITYSSRDYLKALKELDGTFIKIDGGYAEYNNPSVNDFIHNYIFLNDYEYKELCRNCNDFSQMIALFNLSHECERIYSKNLCKKYRVEFTEALFNSIKQKGEYLGIYLTYIGSYTYYSWEDSYLKRIIALMHMNKELNFEEINRFILEDYLIKLPDLIQEHKNKPSDYEVLLSTIKDIKLIVPSYDHLLDSIWNYSINTIKDEKAYLKNQDNLYIFPTIQEVSKGRFDHKITEAKQVFVDYKINLLKRKQEFDEAYKCEGTIEVMESMGEFFSVNVDEDVQELCELQSNLKELDNEEKRIDTIGRQSNHSEEIISDDTIIEMFNSLLE